MKRIQLLATRPYGHYFPIVSWLVRLFEWSKQSHVVLYFPETQIVRHAHFNNFKEQNVDEFMKNNRLINMKTINLSDEQFARLDEYSMSKLGKQTGYFSTLFGSLIPNAVRNLFGKKLHNPFYKGMTCSEYVRESLRKVDEIMVFVLTNDIAKGNFSTDDAMELASKLASKY